VATSSAEAEYTAASDCAREAMWVRKLVADVMELDSIPVTPILEDNAAAAKWCYNPLNHAKQKHIDIAYHFIREQVAEFGNLTIVSVPTVDQLADLGTKALASPRFEYLVRKVFNIAPDRSLRTTATVDMTADSQVHPALPTPASRHTDSTEVPVRRLPTTFKRLRPTLENKFRVDNNGCNGDIIRSTAAAV
jgi:hypothetical protein